MSNAVVIGLASIDGAGKGELARELQGLNAGYMHVGGVVREAAKAAGFVPAENTREAYLPFWEQHSQEHGESWIAQLAIKQAEKSGQPIIVDGVRIAADASTISKHGVMAWLDADLWVAAHRIIQRDRPEDQHRLNPETYIEAMQRDLADEGNFALGAIRGLCDIVIPAVPDIEDPIQRSAHFRVVAAHLLERAGTAPVSR